MDNVIITKPTDLFCVGDQLVWSDKDDKFVFTITGSSTEGSYEHTIKLSIDRVKALMNSNKAKFDCAPNTNVERELNKLEDKYTELIKGISTADMPECLKVESTTVYENLIKLIKHIKNING